MIAQIKIMKKTVNYQSKTVTIIHQENIIDKSWKLLNMTTRCIVISDQNLKPFYHELLSSIPNLIDIIYLQPGDQNKSLSTYHSIIEQFEKLNVQRNDEIIGFGGGVITDITGFVAGTYLRGLSFTLIPTSLLGMVDASIGGKCGINYQKYKNHLGLFNHPKKIIIDEQFLRSLPTVEMNNGMAEIIKYAIIKDHNMFSKLENNNISINQFIEFSIKTKLKITKKDEFDQNERKLLNFGHTYGHILESFTNYQISHGKAVAYGMIRETTDPLIKQRLHNLLSRYFNLNDITLPTDLLPYLNKDKKAHQDECDVVKIVKIGKSIIEKKKVEDLINEYLR